MTFLNVAPKVSEKTNCLKPKYILNPTTHCFVTLPKALFMIIKVLTMAIIVQVNNKLSQVSLATNSSNLIQH